MRSRPSRRSSSQGARSPGRSHQPHVHRQAQRQADPPLSDSQADSSAHLGTTLRASAAPHWQLQLADPFRAQEFLVTEKSTAVVGVHIFDDNSLVSDMSLGFVKIKLTDILEANAKQQDWFPLSRATSGRVRITAEWKPVLMAGAINGAGAYTPPIGVVRLWCVRSSRRLLKRLTMLWWTGSSARSISRTSRRLRAARAILTFAFCTVESSWRARESSMMISTPCGRFSSSSHPSSLLMSGVQGRVRLYRGAQPS